MNQLYSTLLHLVILWLRLRTLWHPKTAQWLRSRKVNNYRNYSDKENTKKYWFHCASLGEYEQAHPLILKLKSKSPQADILLSFFSISGFENLPNNSPVDFVFYLPFDFKKKITKMVDYLDPDMLFLVKSEIWPNLIQVLSNRDKPIFLTSAKFDPGSLIFRIPLLKNGLNSITKIFTQDEASTAIANRNLSIEVLTTGNTRIERVMSLRKSIPDDQKLMDFCKGRKLIVLGSIYLTDIKIFLSWINSKESSDYNILIAPHEIDSENIKKIQECIERPSVIASNPNDVESRIMILDSIGQLSRIYRYSFAAYIGGGFEKGIHNILEPAVHGIPVCFGPKYEAFTEAKTFIENKSGFCVRNAGEFQQFIKDCNDVNFLSNISNIQKIWFRQNASSTTIILDYLQTYNFIIPND